MRLLISNDDGIHARGLAVLTLAAREFAPDADIIVVAPDAERSGSSHRITLAEVQVQAVDPGEAMAHVDDEEPAADAAYAVAGTPADCVRLALAQGGLLERQRAGFVASRPVKTLPGGPPPDWLPDLVLSGINQGANIGHDLHYSGTVAVACEAAGFGVPAVAFSRLRRGLDMLGEEIGPLAATTAALLRAWVADGTLQPGRIRPGSCATVLNVNFPGLPAHDFAGVQVTRAAGYYYNESFQRAGRKPGADGEYLAIRAGEPPWVPDRARDGDSPPTDQEAIADGRISVTPLLVDWTAHPDLQNLADRATDWSLE